MSLKKRHIVENMTQISKVTVIKEREPDAYLSNKHSPFRNDSGCPMNAWETFSIVIEPKHFIESESTNKRNLRKKVIAAIKKNPNQFLNIVIDKQTKPSDAKIKYLRFEDEKQEEQLEASFNERYKDGIKARLTQAKQNVK